MRRRLCVLFLVCFVVLGLCEQTFAGDPNRYISIDEVKPGMQAYCRTVYKGTEIEKFDMEVVSVVYNIRPSRMPGSRNAILVKGTDERFIHTGPVHGCSGSPVYIDGRLAGALAFGWAWSKDPLYGVTPIEDMLTVGTETRLHRSKPFSHGIDFSKPLDLNAISKRVLKPIQPEDHTRGQFRQLPIVLSSSLPVESQPTSLKNALSSAGFFSVYQSAGLSGSDPDTDVDFEPGASLAVPLISGDIQAAAIGTVTDVVGDKVYGFGHGFLGYGPVDLPMATAKIHTVVASNYDSFKFGRSGIIKGAIRSDQGTAVYGQIGRQAKTIPLHLHIDRYNDPQPRTYDCRIAVNPQFTPMMTAFAISGAVGMTGSLPPDHLVRYQGRIVTAAGEAITFKNISTLTGLNELITESVGTVALLIENPYQRMDIAEMAFDIQVEEKNILSAFWSASVSNTEVKPGETIALEIILERYLKSKKQYTFDFEIPETLEDGTYALSVMGGRDYLQFLQANAPYKFLAMNYEAMVKAIEDILDIRRDRLYIVLELPPGGIALENAELPDLPDTVTQVLVNPKRSLKTMPYKQWIMQQTEIDSIPIDKISIPITVEQ